MILLWVIVFIISLFFLLRSSEFFVDSSVAIGTHFKIPPHIIGITLVALGTSLPELASSFISVLSNSAEFVAGNVIGSNNANILFVIGVTALIAKRIDIDYRKVKGSIPFLVGSALFLVLTCYDGTFGRIDAIIGICALIAFLLYCFKSGINFDEDLEEQIEEQEENVQTGKIGKQYAIFLVSLVLIYFSAKYLIESVKHLSEIFHIGKEIIGLTVVALGTSLPELIVSLMAVKKNQQDIAISNVIGSNIFNILSVMSIPALVAPLPIEQKVLHFSLPVMIVATLIYLYFVSIRKVERWHGIILTILYVFFITYLFL